jgi:hypothetical protein
VFDFDKNQTDARVSASSLCSDEKQSSLLFIHPGIYQFLWRKREYTFGHK